jgi:hypothetical protein
MDKAQIEVHGGRGGNGCMSFEGDLYTYLYMYIHIYIFIFINMYIYTYIYMVGEAMDALVSKLIGYEYTLLQFSLYCTTFVYICACA